MATYTHHYSNFPNEIYTPHNFKDVDSTTIGIHVNEVKRLMKNGNYRDAQEYIALHKTELEPYLLTAEHINMIEEELRNIEIYILEHNQA